MAEKKLQDLTKEQNLYLMQRWAEHLKPYKKEAANCGVGGIVFTEKAPDMPWKSISYGFTDEGLLKIYGYDIEGNVIIEYESLEIGYRSLMDPNFDTFKAVEEGKFKVPEEAFKMAPIFPRMREAFRKAVEDAEKKFNIKLPRY